MSADQIFVLLLVAGIVIGLGWLSRDSRRREQLEKQRQPEAEPLVVDEVRPEEVQQSERRRRRRR